MSMNPPPSRPPSGGQNGGKIDNQVYEAGRTPDGRVAYGWRVYFTTAKGATGQTFIPEANYTPQNVLATVRQLANMLDEVHGANI